MAYGLTFLFPAADKVVGASLRTSGEFARVELDFFAEMAQSASGTMIDVGANIGSIALPFAARRPDWRVIAIEAHRGLSGVLHANSLNNRLHNVEVIHAAAGGEQAFVDFPAAPLTEQRNFGEMGFKSVGATEVTSMFPLDQLAPADTQLVKIDVEGFEPEVLKGARELIRGQKAIWLVEATIQHPEAAATTIGAFQEAGYSVHWFYAPFVTPAAAKGKPSNPMSGDANIVALPPGAANTWSLPIVGAPDEKRPGHVDAYPYLRRYGYA